MTLATRWPHRAPRCTCSEVETRRTFLPWRKSGAGVWKKLSAIPRHSAAPSPFTIRRAEIPIASDGWRNFSGRNTDGRSDRKILPSRQAGKPHSFCSSISSAGSARMASREKSFFRSCRNISAMRTRRWKAEYSSPSARSSKKPGRTHSNITSILKNSIPRPKPARSVSPGPRIRAGI